MAAVSLFDDPAHWRQRAKEMRIMADGTNYPKAKTTVLQIANDRDKLAQRAEIRLDGQPQSSAHR